MQKLTESGSERLHNRTLIVAAVLPPAIMQNLNMTIASMALPHMQSALSAGPQQIGSVLTSYVMSAAIAMPLAGYLGARFGARPLLVVALAGFALASLGCASAQTLNQLILFRTVQGAFGAAFIPMSQIILLDIYPRDQHSRAMALWGIGVMIGPILGPILGGYLTEYFGWRAIFLMNLPVSIAALLPILATVPNTKNLSIRPFDFAGYLLLALTIGSMQLTIDRGQSQGWLTSNEIIFELVLTSLFLYMLVAHVLTKPQPFLELQLFLDRSFSVALVLNFIIGGIFFATLAIMPLFLQSIVGYPVLTAGVLLIPRGIGMAAGMFLVGWLPARSDPRIAALIGIIFVAFSLLEMSRFNHHIGQWPIIYTGFLQGCGLGILFVILSATAFATLKKRFRAEGAAMFNLARNIGSSFATGGLFAFLVYNGQINMAGFSEQITPINLSLKESLSLNEWGADSSQTLAILEVQIAYQVAAMSILNSFRIMMWLSLILLPVIFVLRRREETIRHG